MDDNEKLSLVWNDENKELTDLGLKLLLLVGMEIARESFKSIYKIIEKEVKR